MASSNRIYFLDNLRAFVILLVVVLHGAITYMSYAPSWWYVLDPDNSLFFTALVLLVDVPIMLIMFFIAGYFAFPSLVKRGPQSFWQDKVLRIGLPWLFGVLLLAPPTAYLIYFSRHVPVSYLQFWQTDFWGPMYQQSVYWFLGILFFLFIGLSLVYAWSERFRRLRPKSSAPSWRLFSLFVILTSASFLGINLFFPLDTWTHAGYIFMFQPLRVPLYLGYFVLGIYAYQHGWFTATGYHPQLRYWGPLFILAGLFYLGYRFMLPESAQTTISLKAITAILFNTFCFSALMAGVAFFARYVNGVGAFWRSQASNSYGIYYVHPLFLYPLALLFVQMAWPLFLKATTLIILAILLSWGFSALVLKRAPLLRQIF